MCTQLMSVLTKLVEACLLRYAFLAVWLYFSYCSVPLYPDSISITYLS